MPGIWS